MAYKMVIYRKTVSDGWIMPYVPASGLDINEDQGTDDFASVNKNYSVPNAVSPLTFGWSGIFPCRSSQWANAGSKATPHAFRKWVRENRAQRNFFHCTVTTKNGNGTKVIDGDFIMTKFTFNPRQSGDVDISMEFKAYPKVQKTKGSAAKTKSGTGQSAAVSAAIRKTANAIQQRKDEYRTQIELAKLQTTNAVAKAKAGKVVVVKKKK